MKKIRFEPIPGDFINHTHFCLLDVVMDWKSFVQLCPAHICKKNMVIHDDYCDFCKYFSEVDFSTTI